MNFFIPILLIAISIGTFFTYIDPEYKEVQSLRKIDKEFRDKRDKANEIKKKKRELTKQYDQNISTQDIVRLEKLLPNHMNNVELIVDIDRIAKIDGIRIEDISLVKNLGKNNKSGNIEIVENKKYESVNLSFSFITKYENFKSFIGNLRNSLRLLDIVSVDFEKQKDKEMIGTDNFRFNIVVRAYWLKK